MTNRKDLIFKQRKDKNSNGSDTERLMLTHTKANPPIHMWIRQSKKLLARNDCAKEIVGRIQIGSRQPRNLLRMVGGCKGGTRGLEIPLLKMVAGNVTTAGLAVQK